MVDKKPMNNRPRLLLEKEIISKADVYAIESMRTSDRSGKEKLHSSVPTIPTTWGILGVEA